MPLLYRHVIPSVPAWTAGNGGLVYGRDGLPSRQRRMKFRVRIHWDPDFCRDSWWTRFEPAGFTRWLGPVDKDDLEDALNDPAGGYESCRYNSPPGGLDNGVALYLRTGSSAYRHEAAPGEIYAYDWRANATGALYLDWDASNAWWRWRFVVEVRAIFRWCESYGGLDGSTASPPVGSVEFSSGHLLNDLRPGAGISLSQVSETVASGAGSFNATGATLVANYA